MRRREFLTMFGAAALGSVLDVADARAGGRASAEEAMRHCIRSLLNADGAALLDIISREKPFVIHYDMTGAIGGALDRSDSHAELGRSVAGHGDLWADLMGRPETGLDCFADRIIATGGADWNAVGEGRFVPPDAGAASPTFLGFRAEGGAWFLDAIGYPSA